MLRCKLQYVLRVRVTFDSPLGALIDCSVISDRVVIIVMIITNIIIIIIAIITNTTTELGHQRWHQCCGRRNTFILKLDVAICSHLP